MSPPVAKSPQELWFPLGPPRAEAPLRLFCFPYAGGGAMSFRTWVGKLPGGIEVVPVQAPGREQRLSEAPIKRIDAFVETFLPVVEPFLEGPFAFYGHSVGALVAYQVARALRDRGGPTPRHLLVGASRPPQAPKPPDPIHVLKGDAFLERLRVLGGTPPQVLESADLMELFTPMLLADFEMSETYGDEPLDPLDAPISAFAGTEDGEVSVERVGTWSEQTNVEFHLTLLPGKHFFLHTAEAEHLKAMWSELVARGTVAQP